jgi:uncharacterized protein
MKKLLFLALVVALSSTAFAQSNTKTEKIRKLLEVTGSGKLGIQVINNIVDMYKQSYSEVQQTFWEEFRKEANTDDLVNLIIPIYEKFYTEEEITQLIAFYESPLGKKVVQTLPGIMQESMKVGEAWGKQISERIAKKLIAEGFMKEG